MRPSASAFRRPIERRLRSAGGSVRQLRARRRASATWQLVAEPGNPSSTRFDLRAIGELAAIDGLIKLDDGSHEAVRAAQLRRSTRPTSTLKMPSGAAFVAESPQGITALVLRGDGEVVVLARRSGRAGPAPDPRRRAGAHVEDRRGVRPDEPAGIRDAGGVEDARRDARRPAPARRAPRKCSTSSRRARSTSISRGLSTDRWSLEPSPGNVVVEFRSRRFGWLTYALAPNEAEDISVFDRGRGRNISVYTSNEQLSRRGRFYSDDDERRVRHRALRARPGVRSGAVVVERTGGRARCAPRARLAGTLTFRLAAPLTVSSVSVAGLGPLHGAARRRARTA